MRHRALESGLAWFTAGMLVIYVPVETWISWPGGLLHPMYLVDLFAMCLLGFGAYRSLRARPEPAPTFLAVAYAWTAANAWRGFWWRALAVGRGEPLEYGAAELWGVGVGLAIALAGLALSFYLALCGQPSGASR